MSDIWSHSHDWDNGYCAGHKDGYQQGRADAFDEFCKYIDKHSHISADGCEICLDDDITILAEQIKEMHKNAEDTKR